MSFLAPLFLAAGAAAVAVPVVLHLLRPTPRRPRLFSAVQFLDHAPSWTVRRRRLEDWPLFLVRGLILCLLGGAFAQPLLSSLEDVPATKHVALLVDVSASMRRGDLVDQARREVRAALDALGPRDEVSIAVFDDRLTWLARADELRALPPAARRERLVALADSLEVGWRSTDLAGAIARLSETMPTQRAADKSGSAGPTDASTLDSVIVFSDFARGSRHDGLATTLEAAPWSFRPVRLEAKGRTNAGLQLLPIDAATITAEPPRYLVRVSNAGGSEHGDFRLSWHFESTSGEREVRDVALNVPDGQRRVATAPAAPDGMRLVRATLAGDDHTFDNTLEIAAPHTAETTVIFLGDDRPDDPDGMRYFVDRAFPESPGLRVRVVGGPEGVGLLAGEAGEVPLVIVAGAVSGDVASSLAAWVAEGGQLLVAARDDGACELFVRLFARQEGSEARSRGATPFAEPQGVPRRDAPGRTDGDVAHGGPAPEAGLAHPTATAGGADGTRSVPATTASDGSVTLAEIDFAHPLFVPFAGPQFGDFSKIRFWKHRAFDASRLEAPRVLARFDDGGAALVEVRRGAGRAILLASGWQSDDSQLARSSRFAPLLNQLLRLSPRCRTVETNVTVGDTVPLAALARRPPLFAIAVPSGRTVRVEADAVDFTATDAPGRYTILPDSPTQSSVEDAAGVRSGQSHRRRWQRRPRSETASEASDASHETGDAAEGRGEFCVQCPPSETDTSPVSDELLLGSAASGDAVRFAGGSGGEAGRGSRTKAGNSRNDISAQSWWRVLILATLALVVLETTLANRRRAVGNRG